MFTFLLTLLLLYRFTVADWLKAVRALEILGVLFIGGAGICGFLKLFVSKNQNFLPKIAAATGIAAGE